MGQKLSPRNKAEMSSESEAKRARRNRNRALGGANFFGCRIRGGFILIIVKNAPRISCARPGRLAEAWVDIAVPGMAMSRVLVETSFCGE